VAFAVNLLEEKKMGEVSIVEDGTTHTVYSCWDIQFTALWHPALIECTHADQRHDIFLEAIDQMYEINSTTVYLASICFQNMDIRWSSEQIDDSHAHVWFELSAPIVVEAEAIFGNLHDDHPPSP
jgi:hypothetical protein